jgi:hypothetical protein
MELVVNIIMIQIEQFPKKIVKSMKFYRGYTLFFSAGKYDCVYTRNGTEKCSGGSECENKNKTECQVFFFFYLICSEYV